MTTPTMAERFRLPPSGGADLDRLRGLADAMVEPCPDSCDVAVKGQPEERCLDLLHLLGSRAFQQRVAEISHLAGNWIALAELVTRPEAPDTTSRPFWTSLIGCMLHLKPFDLAYASADAITLVVLSHPTRSSPQGWHRSIRSIVALSSPNGVRSDPCPSIVHPQRSQVRVVWSMSVFPCRKVVWFVSVFSPDRFDGLRRQGGRPSMPVFLTPSPGGV